MDVRVLRYFLTVANEGNITKAAEILHITQPTLSRQMMDLEQEMNTTLFIRNKRKITLTQSGVLFQQRAKELVFLLDKTKRDLSEQEETLSGIVSIGCVESTASVILPEVLGDFSETYPLVKYELYSADGDDIRDKIDRGQVDVGILLEPIETSKYDYIRLPFMENWGVLVRRDDPLAVRESISIEEILDLPLIVPRRTIVVEEIAGWLGVESSRLNIFASHNLLTNASLLVERGLGYAICVSGAYSIRETERTVFIPFAPERITGHVLAWKKNQLFNSTTCAFLEFIKTAFKN